MYYTLVYVWLCTVHSYIFGYVLYTRICLVMYCTLVYVWLCTVHSYMSGYVL